jgi:hypothetical protein
MRALGIVLTAVLMLGVAMSSGADDEPAAGVPDWIEWDPRTLSPSLLSTAKRLASDGAMSEGLVENLVLDDDPRLARLGVLVALARGDDVRLRTHESVARRVAELAVAAAAEGATAFAWELAALTGPRGICAHLDLAECPELTIVTTNCPDSWGRGGGPASVAAGDRARFDSIIEATLQWLGHSPGTWSGETLSWVLREWSLLREQMVGNPDYEFRELTRDARAAQPALLTDFFDSGEPLLQEVALGAWALDQRPFDPLPGTLDARVLDAVLHAATDPRLLDAILMNIWWVRDFESLEPGLRRIAIEAEQERLRDSAAIQLVEWYAERSSAALETLYLESDGLLAAEAFDRILRSTCASQQPTSEKLLDPDLFNALQSLLLLHEAGWEEATGRRVHDFLVDDRARLLGSPVRTAPANVADVWQLTLESVEN